MPLDKSIRKTLVIGSGPIVIGQAAEFDYAGTQACRVLKAAGVNVVLLNSNPATIMTDRHMADEIYLEPLTTDTVKRIILKERPDSLLAGLGGQTGLTLAMQLSKEGFLEKHGVRLIGVNVDAIDRAEDRELFKETMEAIHEPVIPSDIAGDLETSLAVARKIGYPVIVRPAFTLGGGGGGVAYNEEELRIIAATGLEASPITQILVEKYIAGWKEIEFEVMRDHVGNAIAICSMENFDPVGIHTGDSIVVAPALTLSSREYGMLRSAALNIIEALGIVGGCNCQFALNPNSFEYAVIEVNPRVSRSSALASKATGYPIAKVTAKIALGYTLDEIENDITGKTCACFEPAVDYVVVKLPKWPFEKFVGSSRILGTQMKATGEVMSIGASFEEAIMKAVRGAEISLDTLNLPGNSENVRERLSVQDDHRLFTVFEALKQGVTVDEIHEITRIDRYFLSKLLNLANFEKEIAGKALDNATYMRAKRMGYPDKALARLTGCDLPGHAVASYKMVDTCAAEFDARTPYFYSSYEEECESRAFARSGRDVVVVLGAGPIRIGQGIEFDYSCVRCISALKAMGYDVVIINNNPETVSTDYDTADRLYFEPLTPEDVMNVLEVEKPVGVVVAFGGQTAIKLTKFLNDNGIAILGTSAEGIDLAEDRERFDALLEQLGVKRPRGFGVRTMEEALEAAESLTYPVLLRPSYVIGGQNMQIVHDETEARAYMDRILAQGIENPVLVDKYMPGTEIEVDVISDGEDVLIPGIMEHIERAGVHSGDSIAVYPPYNLNDRMTQTVVDASVKLALALGTRGLVNIQFLIYLGELYVIEVNPRASRTVPYISKVTGVPMVDLASAVMVGKSLKSLGYGTGLHKAPPYVTVKVPVFSFEKLQDANATLGPEMKSTGEVLGVGKDMSEALFKGLTSAGMMLKLDRTNAPGAYISVNTHDQGEIIPLAEKFIDLGVRLYATEETALTISRSLGVDVQVVPAVSESREAFELLESGKISFVIYTGALADATMQDYIALHRRAVQLSIPCLSSLDTANALADIMLSRYNQHNTELIDINNLRTERHPVFFSKMNATGDDYIFINNFAGEITCPESLCVRLCRRHTGIGALGIVLLEPSTVADAKMRLFNRDGSEGFMGGNSIRCAAKYLYEHGMASSETVTVETLGGVRTLRLYTSSGRVTSAEVEMGKVDFDPKSLPCTLSENELVDYPVTLDGEDYRVTCLSVGNPHCVVFVDRVDKVDIERVGPMFEHAPFFPERTNTEFVRFVNRTTLQMRTYERGSGETPACGTGACAAVAAAVRLGLCAEDEDVTVKVRGGEMVVRVRKDGSVTLFGDAALSFEGMVEY